MFVQLKLSQTLLIVVVYVLYIISYAVGLAGLTIQLMSSYLYIRITYMHYKFVSSGQVKFFDFTLVIYDYVAYLPYLLITNFF